MLNIWREQTIEKVTSIESGLRFQKAMLTTPGTGFPQGEETGHLTHWLDDAILLVGHLIDDLRDL